MNREWKCQYNPETKELDYSYRHGCSDGFEDVHVIEYSAYEEMSKRCETIGNSRYREIDVLEKQNKIMRSALNFYAAGENIYMNPMGLTEGKRGPRFGTRAKEALEKCGGTEPTSKQEEK